MSKQTQAVPSAHVADHTGTAPSRSLPPDLVADLRTDQAGEVGAVCIYLGVLRISRDPGLRAFATRHLDTERVHLQRINAWLPASERSRLLPLWRLAGWLTGALPALAGPRAVYATIEAVEQFVDQHYAEQIERLADQPRLSAVRQTLLECQQDEVHHRDEAAAALGARRHGVLLRFWCALVGAGSRSAVRVCRHL